MEEIPNGLGYAASPKVPVRHRELPRSVQDLIGDGVSAENVVQIVHLRRKVAVMPGILCCHAFSWSNAAVGELALCLISTDGTALDMRADLGRRTERVFVPPGETRFLAGSYLGS